MSSMYKLPQFQGLLRQCVLHNRLAKDKYPPPAAPPSAHNPHTKAAKLKRRSEKEYRNYSTKKQRLRHVEESSESDSESDIDDIFIKPAKDKKVTCDDVLQLVKRYSKIPAKDQWTSFNGKKTGQRDMKLLSSLIQRMTDKKMFEQVSQKEKKILQFLSKGTNDFIKKVRYLKKNPHLVNACILKQLNTSQIRKKGNAEKKKGKGVANEEGEQSNESDDYSSSSEGSDDIDDTEADAAPHSSTHKRDVESGTDSSSSDESEEDTTQ